MMPVKMTLNEYLALEGLESPFCDFMLDKLKIPHGLTARQQKQLEKEADAASDKYHRLRTDAIERYNRLVAAGEIIPKTKIEEMIEVARNGHPDNEATHAARRALEKRGIDWIKGGDGNGAD